MLLALNLQVCFCSLRRILFLTLLFLFFRPVNKKFFQEDSLCIFHRQQNLCSVLSVFRLRKFHKFCHAKDETIRGRLLNIYAVTCAALLRFSFFIRLRCHFHLIWRFFFQRLELLFIWCCSGCFFYKGFAKKCYFILFLSL